MDPPIPPPARNTMGSRAGPDLLGLTAINKPGGINPAISRLGTAGRGVGVLML